MKENDSWIQYPLSLMKIFPHHLKPGRAATNLTYNLTADGQILLIELHSLHCTPCEIKYILNSDQPPHPGRALRKWTVSDHLTLYTTFE